MLGVRVAVDGKTDKADAEFSGEETAMAAAIVEPWARNSKRTLLKGIVVVDEFLVSCVGSLTEKAAVDVQKHVNI